MAEHDFGYESWLTWKQDVLESAEPAFMTACEQMYFASAPLAHVVQYETQLRESRERRMRSGRAVPLPSTRYEPLALR